MWAFSSASSSSPGCERILRRSGSPSRRRPLLAEQLRRPRARARARSDPRASARRPPRRSPSPAHPPRRPGRGVGAEVDHALESTCVPNWLEIGTPPATSKAYDRVLPPLGGWGVCGWVPRCAILPRPFRAHRRASVSAPARGARSALRTAPSRTRRRSPERRLGIRLALVVCRPRAHSPILYSAKLRGRRRRWT